MKKRVATWKLISHSLERNIPVMLLYVLESLGSSPGRQGFFMAVNREGNMQGSIGGGIMEHKFVEMATERLKKEDREWLVKKQVHDKSASKNQSGMICSGEQTVLVYHVAQEDRIAVNNVIECLESNSNGHLELSPEGIRFFEDRSVVPAAYRFVTEEEWSYSECIGYKDQLYIIGGGHCALALSKIMNLMDFYIHLFDDRKELNTMEENTFVQEKHLVTSYSDLSNLIAGGFNNYIVIMSFGYRTDDLAVRALLGKDFKYIGLLGSKKKIEKMFSDYRAEGIDEVLLKKIHAPVGLDIKSETPEEIAISIAAEIIKIKNER
jgi:xanthine dehydrogenase accessory factor